MKNARTKLKFVTFYLPCHYDIFSIEAILKHKTSSLHEKKNAVYHFQMSLFVPEIFEFLKYAN